jgi:hypothetical protein
MYSESRPRSKVVLGIMVFAALLDCSTSVLHEYCCMILQLAILVKKDAADVVKMSD